MDTRGASIDRLMHPLFQEGQGGSIPTAPLSAKELWLEKISFDVARRLNRAWHSRMPRFGTGAVDNMPFICFAACDKSSKAYAVAIWSNPVARLLPQDTWLELRRLADAPDAPRNTASRMLRVMALLVKRERPHLERLISYQDTETHTGAIYKAAGWVATSISDGDEWDRPNRSRPKAQSNAPKVRWEKDVA